MAVVIHSVKITGEALQHIKDAMSTVLKAGADIEENGFWWGARAAIAFEDLGT